MHMESMKQAAARYRPVSIGAGTVEVCREAGGACICARLSRSVPIPSG